LKKQRSGSTLEYGHCQAERRQGGKAAAGFVFGVGDPVLIGLPERTGNPYANRSFELGWNELEDVFELVFDEAQINASANPLPDTWRVLYTALDETGSTVDP